MANIKAGVRVAWTYVHHLNSKSVTQITKHGTVIEITGGIKNIKYVSGTHAKVKFDGNKTISKIPIKELTVLL